MLLLAVAVALASVWPPGVPGDAQSADDAAVYQVILAHTLQRHVDRYSAPLGVRTPAPVLTFDRTLTFCPPDAALIRTMGCILDEVVESVERILPEMQKLRFQGLLTAAYSGDGNAIVSAHYVCGALCEYGWLFLLERRGMSWQVTSVELLSIS